MSRLFLGPLLASLVVFASAAHAKEAAKPRTEEKPAPKKMRRLTPADLEAMVRDASSNARLPRGAQITAVRSRTPFEVPSFVTMTAEITPPARRAGTVTTTAVLTFKDDTNIVARELITLDVAIPREALVRDVTKGASITLIIDRGLVEVTAPGVAGADADIGDVVPVLLKPSGRVMRAKLTAKDKAIAIDVTP